MKEHIIPYGSVAGLTSIALLIELLFGETIGRASSFLIFLPVIAFAAWQYGLKVSLAATSVSSLLIAYFFLPQISASFISGLTQLYLFFAEGLFLGILLDARGHNNIIRQLEKKHTEQVKQIIGLEQKYALAKQEIKARDEFLSIASHELKTPLTSMLLQLQRALHNIRNVSLANFSVESLLKMLESAERQTSRLSKMINDLLNVSLISTKKMDLELEEFNISDLTTAVVESFSEKFEREGYKPKLHIQDSVKGKWDKVRIEQALTNLLSNAVKYGDKKPIAIDLTNHNGSVKISVADQGIGIPRDQEGKIFALFERGKMNGNHKGLGVGLYITNEIVKAHKGKIELESKENKGTKFTMELPLRPN